MALREYRDRNGRPWTVWNVAAKFNPARSGEERRVSSRGTSEKERRTLEDRRGMTPPPEWVHGWLVFQTTGEKRRLAPVPSGWDSLPESELEELRNRAQVIADMQRLSVS
jgi:hypothetical protein